MPARGCRSLAQLRSLGDPKYRKLLSNDPQSRQRVLEARGAPAALMSRSTSALVRYSRARTSALQSVQVEASITTRAAMISARVANNRPAKAPRAT
jgi:hypothetical protein